MAKSRLSQDKTSKRKNSELERLERELSKRQELTKSLLALSAELQSSINSDQVIQAIYRSVLKDLNYPSCWIYYKKPDDHDQVYLWAVQGTATELVGTYFQTIPLHGDAYLDEIFQMKGPVYVEDAQTDPRVNAEIVARLKNRTIINTAFSLTGVPEGVLAMGTFGKEGIRTVSESELEYIETIAGLVAVTIDRLMVQEQKDKAERIVRENEERYRVLSSLMSDLVYKLQVEPDGTLIVEWMSGSLEKITGYSVDEIKVLKFNTFVYPDDLSAVQKIFAGVLRGKPGAIEYRIKHKSGEIRWLAGHDQPLYDPDKKRVTHILGGILDITDRKLAENKIRAQKEFLNEVIESLTHPFYVINTSDLTVTMANAAARLNEGGKDRTCYELLHNQNRPCKELGECCPLDVVKSTKAPTVVEHVHYNANGQARVVEVHGYPILDQQGEVIQMIEYILDITERRSLEDQIRQSQKMEAIGQLAGGVAHDFNNMLGVIVGHTELALMSNDAGPETTTHLQEILSAAERSAKLTRQLLAFARKQTVVPQVLNLNETLAGMAGMLKHLIGESIELNWLPGKEVYLVNMDPTQLDQILANLSVNARDAISGVGKLTIETSVATFDESFCENHPEYAVGEFVCLSVSDNGCGMDETTLDRLFEPFFTTKADGKGTGLGLATVYGIAKQNNGFIIVNSECGVGSSFKIYLPRQAGKVSPLRKPSTMIGQKSSGNETILVVEDELSILNIAQMTLTKFGYNVLVATSPTEAIRRAKTFPGSLDILITDLIMPEMNGQELWKKLKSLFPDLKCIYMSGYSGDVISHHGVLEKGVNFLQKPFTRDILGEKVRSVLDSDYR